MTDTPGKRHGIGASSYATPRTGRHPRKPPRNAAELIYEAAANGAGIAGLRSVLKVGGEVLGRWLRESPELQEALEQGREAERRTLHNVLFKTATQGTGRDAIVAAMFLLKARHGYVEGEQPQQSSRVNVTFNIPGAKPLETLEVIDADAVQRLPAATAGITRAG